MIIRATAIPLACHPYSSTSRVVHWLTRRHGKVSTLLKGALRPKSPFLGEYELFGTSELLYYRKRPGTLHVGKECALLQPRTAFRNNWRAMQAASYLSALFQKTTPDEAPQPGLFELYEALLDLAALHGDTLPFLLWAELRFCDFHGHRPNLEGCTLCGNEQAWWFSASAGGTVCTDCVRDRELPRQECPPDAHAILRSWQRAEHPGTVVKTRLSAKQKTVLNRLMAAFTTTQFDLPLEHRDAVSMD